MSVLIKGMRMPENCRKCLFIIEEDIDFDICRQCGAGKSGYIYEKDIDDFPSDCPLIALPDKHGRLVDADNICTADGYLEFTEDEAPTIVESEGSEE